MKIDIEKVSTLNKIQNEGKFHPYTCGNDGDEKHILYEFHKEFPDGNYEEYIKEQKEFGVPFPEMRYTETNLVATQEGWICPVCDYKQKISK
jgi:hypothetical protein